MNLFVIFSALAVFWLQNASAQVPLTNGSCPGMCISTSTFKPEDILGIWYLQEYVDNFLTNQIRCAFLNFTEVTNNGTKLVGRTHYISMEDGKPRSMPSDVDILPNKKIKMNYGDQHLPLEFELIGSSPDYFAAFACYDCGIFSKEGSGFYGAVYTRLHSSECDVKAAGRTDLSVCGIPQDKLVVHDQSNCKLC